MAGASEERLASLREMLADEPGDAFLSYSVAMQLKGLERLEEAAEEFARLVERSPDYLASYYHYASVLAGLGQSERGLELARRGQELAEAAGERHAASELADLIDELDG